MLQKIIEVFENMDNDDSMFDDVQSFYRKHANKILALKYQIAREVWGEYQENVPRDSWTDWHADGSCSVFNDAPIFSWQYWLGQQDGD